MVWLAGIRERIDIEKQVVNERPEAVLRDAERCVQELDGSLPFLHCRRTSNVGRIQKVDEHQMRWLTIDDP